MKRKVRKNSFWVLLFLVIILLCMTAPLYAVYSPTEVDLGSVLQKNETLRAAVITRLTAQFPTLTFPEPVGDAADGAAVMAENS